jgi:nucleoside-diphosphate-sugar epimerase/glycosyltransferase involved in cell wall biosynthesis
MINFNENIKLLKGPILIFGASGFVGCNLLKSIYNVRKDCFAVTHNPKNIWRLKMLDFPKENIINCDINYQISVKSIFDNIRPKTIFNLTAYGAYSKQNSSEQIYQTNILGTLNILNELNEEIVYIHAGSSSEYGTNSKSPKEDAILKPNSHYAISKVTTSFLINYFGKFKNIPCLNLRLYSIYGPWEEPDRLIPKLIENGRNAKYPPLVNKNTTRDFVYIDDCINAFILSAISIKKDFYGESINIGTGIKTSLEDLVKISKNIFKIETDPIWDTMSNRNWDTEDWYGNFDKAYKLIHWTPIIPLSDGLLKTNHWHDEVNYNTTVSNILNLHPNKIIKISAIIACYKDAQAIPIMYKRLLDIFIKIGCSYEIIFVNDNSPDETDDILNVLCKNDINVISIKHSRNFGSQAAFISGMEISNGDAIVLMDGDLQDPPELIENFYNKWLEGYHVVYGRRIKRETSFIMNFSYKLFYLLFSKMSNIIIPKDAGDFSLMDKKVVDNILSFPEKEIFIRGLRAWVGYNQIGVDYIRPERMFGVSTNNLRKNIWWAKKGIFSFSYLPLEIMSYSGIFLTFLSFIAILIQFILKFRFPEIPHGIPTIIILILFFGGLNLLSISIIGEYLSKVVDETKSRPRYIREKVIIKGKIIDSNIDLLKFIKK